MKKAIYIILVAGLPALLYADTESNDFAFSEQQRNIIKHRAEVYSDAVDALMAEVEKETSQAAKKFLMSEVHVYRKAAEIEIMLANAKKQEKSADMIANEMTAFKALLQNSESSFTEGRMRDTVKNLTQTIEDLKNLENDSLADPRDFPEIARRYHRLKKTHTNIGFWMGSAGGVLVGAGLTAPSQPMLTMGLAGVAGGILFCSGAFVRAAKK